MEQNFSSHINDITEWLLSAVANLGYHTSEISPVIRPIELRTSAAVFADLPLRSNGDNSWISKVAIVAKKDANYEDYRIDLISASIYEMNNDDPLSFRRIATYNHFGWNGPAINRNELVKILEAKLDYSLNNDLEVSREYKQKQSRPAVLKATNIPNTHKTTL